MLALCLDYRWQLSVLRTLQKLESRGQGVPEVSLANQDFLMLMDVETRTSSLSAADLGPKALRQDGSPAEASRGGLWKVSCAVPRLNSSACPSLSLPGILCQLSKNLLLTGKQEPYLHCWLNVANSHSAVCGAEPVSLPQDDPTGDSKQGSNPDHENTYGCCF